MAPKIDAPVRLGRGFLALYLPAFGFALWRLHPWSGDDRYEAVLGVILFPFVASLVLYSIALFVWSIVSDFRGQRRAFFVFGLAVLGILVAYTIVSWRDRPISSTASGTVATLATLLLRYLTKKLPNQSLDPTPAPGMPPAGQESRHG